MNQKKRLCLALLSVFVLLCAPAGFAEVEETAAETVQPVIETVSGTIHSIYESSNYIVLEHSGGEEGQMMAMSVFYFSDTSKIIKDGQDVPVSGLKDGDQASVEYVVDSGNVRTIVTLTVN